MTKIKKISIMALMIITTLTTISCGKGVAKEVTVEKPSFETQIIDQGTFTYEIPASWAKVDNQALTAGQVLYAPSSADLTKGTSNANIIISKGEAEAPTLKTVQDSADSQLKAEIIKAFPAATGFKYGDFVAPIGEVFTMDYTIKVSEKNMKIIQYYLLLDDYTIVVTSTDIADGITPSATEVSKYIANSIKKK